MTLRVLGPQSGAYVGVDSAGQAALPSSHSLRDIPLIVNGHSFTTNNNYVALTAGAAPVAGRPATEPWVNGLASELGMILVNRGVAGDMMRDTLSRILGSGATVWTPGATGVSLIESMLNDVRFGGTDTLQRQAFRNALTSAIAVISSGKMTIATDASITYTGTWTLNAASVQAIGQTVKYSTTSGNSFSIPFTGDEITVLCTGLDTTIAGGSATLGVTIDGVAPPNGQPASVNCNGQMKVDTGAQTVNHSISVPLRYTGLGAGAHTIVVTKTDANGSYAYCGGYVQPAAVVAANNAANVPRSPTILVCKDPDIGATSWGILSPYNQGSTAALTSYCGDVDTVAALFNGVNGCSVKAVDLRPNYPVGGCLADSIHPDDTRAKVLIANAAPVVKTLAARGGLYVGA